MEMERDRRNVKRREYVTKEIQSKGVEGEENNSKKNKWFKIKSRK